MGIGNLLLGDDGLGVHAARILLEKKLPEPIEILDVGTDFLSALPALEHAEQVIVVDAVEADHEPGTLYRIPIKRRRQAGRMDSLHGFDMFGMLELARNKKSVKVIVLGIEPAHIGWSMELSKQVSEAMPFLIDSVSREIASFNEKQ